MWLPVKMFMNMNTKVYYFDINSFIIFLVFGKAKITHLVFFKFGESLFDLTYV